MKNRISLAIAMVLALVVYRDIPGMSRVEAAKPPQYVAVALGTLGGSNSYAEGINNKGQVVGGSEVDDTVRHAFLWENGVIRDLGTLGGSDSSARGINNSGVIVGVSTTWNGGPLHAVLWEAGRMRDINPDWSIGSQAMAINDRGEIAGVCVTADYVSHPCVWTNGVARDLGIPSNAFIEPRAINDRGEITGWFQSDQNTNCIFYWAPGIFEIIGPCSGSSVGTGINNRGQIVGMYSFLYDRGVVRTIELILPMAINKSGQIAGGSSSTSNWHASLWDAGVLIDVDPARESTSEAHAINDRAELAGFAIESGRYIAYLWQPTH